MVKSKKLSRGSLAVLILALMLAISMVVGVTGAWFVDNDSRTAEKDYNLAKVKLAPLAAITIDDDIESNAERPEHNIGTAQDVNMVKQVLPGDVFSVSENVITNQSDVRVWVYYTYEFHIKATSYKVYDSTVQGNDKWVAHNEKLELKDVVTESAGSTRAFNYRLAEDGAAHTDATANVLKVYDVGGSYTIPAYEVVFNTTASNNAVNRNHGNFVWTGEGHTTRVVLNNGTMMENGADQYEPENGDIDITNADIEVSVLLEVYALQFDNVDWTALNQWLTDIDDNHGLTTTGTNHGMPADNAEIGSLSGRIWTDGTWVAANKVAAPAAPGAGA